MGLGFRPFCGWFWTSDRLWSNADAELSTRPCRRGGRRAPMPDLQAATSLFFCAWSGPLQRNPRARGARNLTPRSLQRNPRTNLIQQENLSNASRLFLAAYAWARGCAWRACGVRVQAWPDGNSAMISQGFSCSMESVLVVRRSIHFWGLGLGFRLQLLCSKKIAPLLGLGLGFRLHLLCSKKIAPLLGLGLGFRLYTLLRMVLDLRQVWV